MYGSDYPQGLVPASHQLSATWVEKTNSYPISSGFATTLFKGDLVYRAATGYIGLAAPTGGADAVAARAIGVFWGCSYIDASGMTHKPEFWTAGTVTKGAADAEAFIIDDPYVIYSMQVSGGGNTLTRAFLGKNCDISINNGQRATRLLTGGISPSFLNLAAPYDTAFGNMKILALDTIATTANDYGKNYNNAWVTINYGAYKAPTLGTA